MVVTLGQQYNIGETPTVILYTYINRHAGTPEKQSVVVVVDSHIQRFVLATEETTVTQQVSHKLLSNDANPACGHKEVSRSTGHIMVTTRYSDQQGSRSRQKVTMRLYKQWHRPISKRFIKPPYYISRATSIDSECCRLPTTMQRSQQKNGKNTLQPVWINKSKFLKATHCTEHDSSEHLTTTVFRNS